MRRDPEAVLRRLERRWWPRRIWHRVALALRSVPWLWVIGTAWVTAWATASVLVTVPR
jgi:hypothetical protein